MAEEKIGFVENTHQIMTDVGPVARDTSLSEEVVDLGALAALAG
jgi:hypothetical protein